MFRFTPVRLLSESEPRGIVGGFAPPIPDEIHELTRSLDHLSNLLIQSSVRQQGKPQPIAAEPKSLSIPEFSTLRVGAAPTTWTPGLQSSRAYRENCLPNSPPGSEDIYGMNIGILYASDNLERANDDPETCGGEGSTVHETEKQKQQFKTAVEILKGLTAGS